MNKKEWCYKFFDANLGTENQKTIKLAMEKVNLTEQIALSYYSEWRKAYMSKPGYVESPRERKRSRKVNQKPKERVYIDNPERLIDLKQTHTYKEIAKMYNVNPNKIFYDIKSYKEVQGGAVKC